MTAYYIYNMWNLPYWQLLHMLCHNILVIVSVDTTTIATPTLPFSSSNNFYLPSIECIKYLYQMKLTRQNLAIQLSQIVGNCSSVLMAQLQLLFWKLLNFQKAFHFSNCQKIKKKEPNKQSPQNANTKSVWKRHTYFQCFSFNSFSFVSGFDDF